jgi:hypothetical protein
VNSVPQHLHSEDRQEYERVLDEALRSAPHRPELSAVGQRLNPEQLRTMALNATALITAAAATEYQHYVRVREELRHPAAPYESSRSGSAPGSAPSVSPRSGSRTAATDRRAPAGLGRRIGAAVLGAGQPGGHRISNGVAPRRWARMSYGRRLLATVLGLHVRPEVRTAATAAEVRTPRPSRQPTVPRGAGSTERDVSSMGLAATMGEVTETAGAGAVAVAAVLAPVLAGSLMAIFLLIGYVLKMLDAEGTVARALITTGWVFGAVTAAAILFCVAALLLTALRNRPSLDTGANSEVSEEVTRAREAWHDALLERGILPFLREALADPGTAAALRHTAPPSSRMPHLGYDRPGFSTPDDDPRAGSRPSFTRPDYTSPDFGGPDHQSE